MKKNNDNKFSKISSFEDFRFEREELIFRRKLIEAKLNLTYLKIRNKFSVSNQFFSKAKEAVLPKISDFLGVLIKKFRKESHSEPGTNQN